MGRAGWRASAPAGPTATSGAGPAPGRAAWRVVVVVGRARAGPFRAGSQFVVLLRMFPRENGFSALSLLVCV